MTIGDIEQQTKATMEAYIDKFCLENILNLLSDVCFAKCQHLEENWQDGASAKYWETAAKKIGDLADSRAIRALSI